MYESELERTHGQMLEEMQNMEDDKNRAIEEAFARAQVEMKAVHENLAGENRGSKFPQQPDECEWVADTGIGECSFPGDATHSLRHQDFLMCY